MGDVVKFRYIWLMVVALLMGLVVIAPLQAQGKPGAFSLNSPAAGATITSATPNFSWQAASGATKYRLQIRNSAGTIVSKKVFKRAAANCGGTCSVASPYSFANGSYSWRVIAINKAGKTKTGFRTLTVQLSSAPSPAQQVLRLVNEQRCAAGLTPLALNSNLNKAAQKHSNRMARLNFFSHTDPFNGSTFYSRIAAAGYQGTYLGENIAAGQTTAQEVFNTWWNSGGHRTNLMDPAYRHMGLGYASNASSTYRHYWTQTFGTYGGATGGVCPS